MAKKKRSKAQREATKKMQRAARRAKHSGGKRKKARRKNPKHPTRKQSAASRRNLKKAHAGKRKRKACRRAAGKRGAAKRHGKRMPKMPARCAPRKRKKSHGGKRKAAKRASPRRSSGHRKSPKRVAAGRKAAQTRARHRAAGHLTKRDYDEAKSMVYESPRRRRKGRRKGKRRHNPVVNPIRRRRHHGSRRRNPFFGNPLDGPGEVLSGLLGVGTGYFVASAIDRLLATHALVGSGTNYTDSPAAGQLYDTEAPLLPVWADPIRIGAAIGVIFLPGIASRFIKDAKVKAFLQLAAYGAAAKVAGSAIEGGIAALAPTNPYVAQLYGPEVVAQTKLALMGGQAPPANQAAGTFAGVPKNRQMGAAPAARTGVGDGGCQPNCQDTPPVPDQPADPLPMNLDQVPYSLGGGYDPGSDWGSEECIGPPLDNSVPVQTGPSAQVSVPAVLMAPPPSPAPIMSAPQPPPDVLSPPGMSVPQLAVVPPPIPPAAPQPYLPR